MQYMNGAEEQKVVMVDQDHYQQRFKSSGRTSQVVVGGVGVGIGGEIRIRLRRCCVRLMSRLKNALLWDQSR